MLVESFTSVGDFLDVTEDFRVTEPVLTNVIGSIAAFVESGRVFDTCLLLAVRDAQGGVVGCAARTSPWNLVVSPMPVEAAAAVGRHVAAVDPNVPGITGVRSVVEAVTEAMSLDRAPRLAMVDTVRVLDEFVPAPNPAPGTARRAEDQDRDLLIRWLVQFGIDAALPIHDAEASVNSRLQARAFWFWEVDGQPVAMAGHAPVVTTPAGTVGRVGPVYTPAGHRGRGYGAAVTSAVVRALQPACSIIMLYADATNPTSNAVYARLGFRAVAEVIEVELASIVDDFDNHFH